MIGPGAATAAVSKQLYVSASAASDPACGSASQANPFRTIAAALACARNGATVHVGAGRFAGEVTVATNVTMVGVAGSTVIADPNVADDLVPEVSVASGRTVSLRNLQISGTDSAGNPAHAGVQAGAGSLTLQRVDITGTVATHGAGLDVEAASGDANVTVLNSTISNTLALQSGGAILMSTSDASASTLTLLNSTISGNQANNNGGGIYLSGASLTSRESTISANQAFDGGGIYLQLSAAHTATLTGTLLATNTAFDANSGPDCLATAGAGVALISGGHNLIGQDTGANATGCAGFTNNTNGDQVGTATTPINPVLAPLANNGATTPTQALLSGSPAIGTGNTTDCQTSPINNLDQRGKPRHADTRTTCDIGAYDTGGKAPH
jgi:parallel beta-helix repeat protein